MKLTLLGPSRHCSVGRSGPLRLPPPVALAVLLLIPLLIPLLARDALAGTAWQAPGDIAAVAESYLREMTGGDAGRTTVRAGSSWS